MVCAADKFLHAGQEATKEKQRKPLNSVSDKNAADEEVSSSPPKVKQEADRQPEEVDINSDYAPGEDEEEEESEDDPEDLVGSDEDDEDEDQEEQAPNSSRGHAKMARAKRQKTKAPPAVKMAMKRKRSDCKSSRSSVNCLMSIYVPAVRQIGGHAGHTTAARHLLARPACHDAHIGMPEAL